MDKFTFLQKLLMYSAIFVFMVFILLPFVEMFYASLRPLDHLFRSPYQFFSDDLSFWAYREMWNTVPMLGRYIFNSFFLASSVAILTLLFVIPAAYSYARFNFPFKNSSLYILLAINMFSGAVLLIPLYKVLRTFGLLNSYQAMIVPGVAFLIPTSIWLLKSYFEKIPVDLEEAAFVDGASRVQILRHIIRTLKHARPSCCWYLCVSLAPMRNNSYLPLLLTKRKNTCLFHLVYMNLLDIKVSNGMK
jgi:multiple sugar transport system permease protein